MKTLKELFKQYFKLKKENDLTIPNQKKLMVKLLELLKFERIHINQYELKFKLKDYKIILHIRFYDSLNEIKYLNYYESVKIDNLVSCKSIYYDFMEFTYHFHSPYDLYTKQLGLNLDKQIGEL